MLSANNDARQDAENERPTDDDSTVFKSETGHAGMLPFERSAVDA